MKVASNILNLNVQHLIFHTKEHKNCYKVNLKFSSKQFFFTFSYHTIKKNKLWDHTKNKLAACLVCVCIYNQS